MSSARAALLDVLRSQPQPTRVASLAALSGLHENTLRDHLSALVADGLVVRSQAGGAGRGRPAWLYAAVDTDAQTADYAGLAIALSLAVSRSDRAAEFALEAGEEWGRQAARPVDAEIAQDPVRARGRLVEMLARMGFAPESDEEGRAVQLTRCPMLEAACAHPEVVCAVHLGFARGVLEECGVDTADTSLRPFSSPGACELTLTKPA